MRNGLDGGGGRAVSHYLVSASGRCSGGSDQSPEWSLRGGRQEQWRRPKRLTLQETFERQLLEGELDPFDFALAEDLHMTLDELVERISNREYLAWRAFYVWRNNEQERKVPRGEG